jgi:NAD(P)H-nitrite reductase large subunit
LLDKLLSGSIGREAMFPYDGTWYKSRGIQVSLGDRVTGVDVRSGRLKASRSGAEDFDKLLLATGASPFMPPVEGISAKASLYRNIASNERILSIAQGKKRPLSSAEGMLGLRPRSAYQVGLNVTW